MIKDIILIALSSLILFSACNNKKKAEIILDDGLEKNITDTTVTYTEDSASAQAKHEA